ncbi:MAG TPA: Spy/CpxP family protein refolding chaperone [Syntrophobacter fumaroxidans]|nr:Spy/CpxP family protein refolding chaperone [Syntrophobacter fumaroxidans]
MMKKIALVSILVLFTMASVGATVAAAGPRGHGGGGGHGGCMLGTLLSLNLSEAQKHDVAVIMKSNRDEFRTVVGQMREAKKALFDRINAEPLDEEAIRQAVRQLAAVGEQAAVMRGRVLSEIKAVLTPEQRAALADKRVRFGAMFEGRGHRGNFLLDDWIDKYGK